MRPHPPHATGCTPASASAGLKHIRTSFVVASAAGIKDVVFDRGGYIYTGRVAELAAGAREGGLNF